MTIDNFSSHFLSALLPERKGVFMTVSLDLRAIKANARSLLRSGRTRVLKLSALYLAIDLVLNLIDAAVSYMIYSSGGFTVLSFSFVSILVSLISIVLSAGFVRCCLGILRGEYMPYESLFDAFPFAGKVILLSIVEGLFIFLWSMLFVIPGIIAAYRYSFAMMNLCDDPGIGVMEALRRSKQQTDGNKGTLFLLTMSFLGWLLLAGAAVVLADYLIFGDISLQLETAATLSQALLITLVDQGTASLASVWIAPYIQLSLCACYLAVTSSGGAPLESLPGSDPWDDTSF